MSQSDYIEIVIPTLPPGANKTYQLAKNRLILTPAARRWDRDAALIVGSAAGQFDFEPDPDATYQIVIHWWGGRHDTDAHLKLVQDTITRKLGFDDYQIKSCVIERCPDDWREADSEPVGVQVHLFKALEKDWVTELINERFRWPRYL